MADNQPHEAPEVLLSKAADHLRAKDYASALNSVEKAYRLYQAAAVPDFNAMRRLLDDRKECLIGLGRFTKEAEEALRQELIRISIRESSLRAEMEAKSRHIITDPKKDLP